MGFDLKIGTTTADQIDSSTFKIAPIKSKSEDTDFAKTTLELKTEDSVNISAEGLRKSSELTEKSAKEVAQEASEKDNTEEMIRKKIKQLEKELKELRQNPEQNEKAIKMKEQELQQYQGMLMDILNKKKGAEGSGGVGGGTPAQPVKSSLTEVPKGMLCEVLF
ncbi:hypothetical protein [Maridesulfovibrio sp.]|uniref:hypothetical protein n=1 Tax=Maridesulfovibrio sp. TaxID=2795000 RepID=UPI002A18BDC9|nr:hypothetical protein [Maridesulfovibrio sp.]